jgi:hypothetical protein
MDVYRRVLRERGREGVAAAVPRSARMP